MTMRQSELYISYWRVENWQYAAFVQLLNTWTLNSHSTWPSSGSTCLNFLSLWEDVVSMLKEHLGIPSGKTLPTVDYSVSPFMFKYGNLSLCACWTYCHVRRWTLGLTGYRDQIAVIRASGNISRARGPLSMSSSGIVAEQFIEKIRSVRESKRYKALVLCIDSPGGDALASDLVFGDLFLLGKDPELLEHVFSQNLSRAEVEKFFLRNSMADVAASGGYYMAMGAGTIVAENRTRTGSIGVVTGKFNLERLYERIGFNEEIISRGRYAELTAAEQRPFRADEAELFAKSAENAYKSFRDKTTSSRCMSVQKMEEVAQGRVWTGNDAATRGLVDAIGGVSRVAAIAKQKCNLPLDQQVSSRKLLSLGSSSCQHPLHPHLISLADSVTPLLEQTKGSKSCYRSWHLVMEFKPTWMVSCLKNSMGRLLLSALSSHSLKIT